MSYQPEERYWTDYLRIALPVVGLLLMLGLFWYWASAVIGDDDNNPATQPTNPVALVTEEVPTPTPRPDVVINPETVTPEPTSEPTRAAGSDETEEPTEEATDVPDGSEATGKGFVEGDRVVTSSADVRLRVEPSTSADIVEELAEGTELEVLEQAVEADTYFWLHVVVVDSGQEGYVADEFVEPAE